MQFCLCCLFTEYGFLVVNPLLFRMYIRTSPWEGIVRELGMDMWMLLYVKWITNKDLLFSTWSSAQCYMVAQMGGVWGRMDACVCMAGSLCCLPEAVTTLLIGHTPKENKKLKKKWTSRLTSYVREIESRGSGSSPVEPDLFRSAGIVTRSQLWLKLQREIRYHPIIPF